jgi:hypothetical protein
VSAPPSAATPPPPSRGRSREVQIAWEVSLKKIPEAAVPNNASRLPHEEHHALLLAQGRHVDVVAMILDDAGDHTVT